MHSMNSKTKKDPEIFILPNGVSVSPKDTNHSSYLKSIALSALWSDVREWLETVFKSDFSISREDMEYLLCVLNTKWQKKALQGYFYKILWEKAFQNIQDELEQKINSFPTENWTDQNWQVFGDLAPKPFSKKPKTYAPSSHKKPKNRYLSHDAWFRAVIFGYEGSHNSLDWRGQG